jgi:hypothetical protein
MPRHDNLISLAVIFLAIATDFSAAAIDIVNCNLALRLTGTEGRCLQGTSGGSITMTGNKPKFFCYNSSLRLFDANSVSGASTLTNCTADIATFNPFGLPGTCMVNYSTVKLGQLHGTSQLVLTSTKMQKVEADCKSCSLTIFGDSAVETVVNEGKIIIDHLGDRGSQMTIQNSGTSCSILSFPEGGTLCVSLGSCLFNGSSLSGRCLTIPMHSWTNSASMSRFSIRTHSLTGSEMIRTATYKMRSSTPVGSTSQSYFMSKSVTANLRTLGRSSSTSASILFARSPTQTPEIITAATKTSVQPLAGNMTSAAPAMIPAQRPLVSFSPYDPPTAAETGASIVSSTASAVSPGASSQSARVNSLLSMIRCERDFPEKPSYTDYPLQDYGHNTFPATLLITALVNLGLQLVAAASYITARPNPVSNLLAPLYLSYTAPTFARDTSTYWGESPLVLVAAGCMLAALLNPCIMVLRDPPTIADAVNESGKRVEGPLVPRGALFFEFKDAGTAPHCAIYGEFTGGLRCHRSLAVRSALIVEMWLGIICGVLQGRRGDAEFCARSTYAILGLCAAFAIYQVGVAPFGPTFEKRSAQAKAIAQVVLAGFSCIALLDESAGPAVGWIGLILMVYMPIDFGVALFLEKREARRRETYEKEHPSSSEAPLLDGSGVFAIAVGNESLLSSDQPHRESVSSVCASTPRNPLAPRSST